MKPFVISEGIPGVCCCPVERAGAEPVNLNFMSPYVLVQRSKGSKKLEGLPYPADGLELHPR